MTSQPLPAVQLFLLGTPRLMRDGIDQTKALKYRKAWALLGYLSAHPGQWQAREKLADLLWPELDLPAARTNLRQVLSNVSGLVVGADGSSPLERNDSAVRWVAASGLWLDLELLSNKSLAKAGAVDAAARQWYAQVLEPNLKALSGLFLEGVQLPQASEYGRWQQSVREFYRSRSLLLLEQAGHCQQQEGRLHEAIATARHLLELEPLDDGYLTHLVELLAAQGRSSEAVSELRWVAAMYCDFQSQAVMDEDEDDALRARFADSVTRFGGRVFPTTGVGALAVFGMAGTGERVAFRALLSAQDLLAPERRLGARVGICCGKVLFRPTAAGFTVSGEAADLAMRICLTAEPGQVLLSSHAAIQIGRAVSFAEAGVWTFRGLEGRHTLQRWIDDRIDPLGAKLPGRNGLVHANLPFVGRSEALGYLMGKWRQAQAQGGQVVVVRAPAGYGKTRLLQEFSRQVDATGAACVQVLCRLETQHQPMAPFFTVMDQEIATSPTELGSKSEAFALVKDALDQMTAGGPTLVLLDDLHWSDLASQEFLPLFAQGLVGRKVLLVIATRPGLALAYPQTAEVLDLPPLADVSARELVMAHQHAGEPRLQQCDWIVETAGGVPLFLELLAKSPPGTQQNLVSIRDVLQSELDQLGDGKTVLRAAAVIGMRFSPDLLRILLGQADVQGALVRAQSLQLVDADAAGSYRFHHALIHDVVYESVPLGVRKTLHRQWAAHLQSQPGSPIEEIARQWEAAQCWQDAAGWWYKAGDDALQREFAADAVASFQRALHLLAQVDEPVRLVRTYQEAQLRLGYALHMAEGFGSPSAWRLFKDVASHMETANLTEPENQNLLFAALSGCYMGGSSQGELDGLTIAERLSDLARTQAQQLMASCALGNSLFWRGEFDEAGHWQKKGIALSLRLPAKDRVQYCVDDPAVICRAFLAWNLWFQGHDAQASAMALDAIEWANKGKRSHAQCFGFTLLLGVYWCQGKMAELGSLAMRTHALAKQYGFPLWESVSGLFLLCAHAHRGALSDTTPLFDAARQMQLAYQAGITTSRWIAADALVAQGEWTQALALLDVSIAEADTHEDQYCIADLLWLQAKCQAATGHAEQSVLSRAKAYEVAHQLGAHGLLARYR